MILRQLIAVLLLSCGWIYGQTATHSASAKDSTNPRPTAAQQSGSATGEVGWPNGVTSRDNGSAKTSNKVSVKGAKTGNVLAVHKVRKAGGSCNAEVPGAAH